MKIRPANLKDIPAIALLYKELFENMSRLEPYYLRAGIQDTKLIKSCIESDSYSIFLSELGGEVCGFIILKEEKTVDFNVFIERKAVYIMDLIVREKYRGQGIGRALMDRTLSFSKEKEAHYISLSVLEKNKRAIEFYEDLGFQGFSRNLNYILKD